MLNLRNTSGHDQNTLFDLKSFIVIIPQLSLSYQFPLDDGGQVDDRTPALGN